MVLSPRSKRPSPDVDVLRTKRRIDDAEEHTVNIRFVAVNLAIPVFEKKTEVDVLGAKRRIDDAEEHTVNISLVDVNLAIPVFEKKRKADDQIGREDNKDLDLKCNSEF